MLENRWKWSLSKLPSRIILCKVVNKQVKFILEWLRNSCLSITLTTLSLKKGLEVYELYQNYFLRMNLAHGEKWKEITLPLQYQEHLGSEELYPALYSQFVQYLLCCVSYHVLCYILCYELHVPCHELFHSLVHGPCLCRSQNEHCLPPPPMTVIVTRIERANMTHWI